jgi:ribosomal protein L11 methyltransferase
VGCGSGILALAALRLGHGPVWALDTDPLAVAATADNAQRNRLPLEARLARAEDPLPEAGTVVANIQLDVLVRLASTLRARPPARAVLSGLRDEDGAEALAAYAALGFQERARIADAGWLTLHLERG